METHGGHLREKPPDPTERGDLTISRPGRADALGMGDTGFREELARLYRPAENNVMAHLTKLKADLKATRTEEEFWPMATQGLAELSGAQYAFISKRMVVDDQDATVEMPPFGTPGSCLMSQAFYYDDGHGQSGNPRNVKYQVYGCPCEHMKHNRVLLIPEKLGDIFSNNPNAPMFVVPADAYLGIPLFDRDGRCFAHFGVMWSREGVQRLTLSWAFLEMIFHALEDVLLSGFLERGRFGSALQHMMHTNAVIPHEAITAAQSLKPYARNLSHELRTPMQGVVGMLDVMYATVQEAAEGQRDNQVRVTLDNLRENIEVAQDSSRRAVEAADNVVHAYDMGMGVPEKPISPPDEEENPVDRHGLRRNRGTDIVVTGENVPINFKGHKRRRESRSTSRALSTKQRRVDALSDPQPVRDDDSYPIPRSFTDPAAAYPQGPPSPTFAHLEQSEQVSIPPGLRHCNLRDLLQFLINDLLKVGGRPDSAVAIETAGGEDIEVRVRTPSGEEKIKHIRWIVDQSVPDTILIEEQSLVKVISSVYSNAVKFTEEGTVILHAQASPKSRYVIIRVRDSGVGIRDEFVPRLFQAFSKEDDSLTRTSEGLGLGLMVAKGLARKLGGDLTLLRTKASGPDHGTEFEIQVPITPSDVVSRPSTPSGSPAPSHRSRRSTLEDDGTSHQRTRSGSFRPYKHPIATIPRRRSDTPPSGSAHMPSPPNTVISQTASALQRTIKTPRRTSPSKRPADFDRTLGQRFPLTFLVVEDNKINRQLLVSMLRKLGYNGIHEAYDGSHAVRQMEALRGEIDVVLMDLWMPYMDGYEASEKILNMSWDNNTSEPPESAIGSNGSRSTMKVPTILAVTADVTDGALEKAAAVGMKGFLTKPFKVVDLERLILEYCAIRRPDAEVMAS